MLTKKELKEIEKSNEQFKKAEQVRMLIWVGFVGIMLAFAFYITWHLK